MIRSSLIDDSEIYTLVKGTTTVTNTGTAAASNYKNKKASIKSCAPFTDCISEINSKEINDTKGTDVVMSMYNLIE